MIEQIKKVAKFHDSFLVENSQKPDALTEPEYVLRYKLLEEELKEYLAACSKGDKVEILDALADSLYILFGTILRHGMQNVIEEAFDRVHQSNMSKLDDFGKPIINGENGYFDETRPPGKILKSKNYKPVDLKDLV